MNNAFKKYCLITEQTDHVQTANEHIGFVIYWNRQIFPNDFLFNLSVTSATLHKANGCLVSATKDLLTRREIKKALNIPDLSPTFFRFSGTSETESIWTIQANSPTAPILAYLIISYEIQGE